MAVNARAWIARKRASGIGDFSADSPTTGDLTLSEAISKGVLTVNSKMEMGIATETEVGLAVDRYPIFVRIVDAANTALDRGADTVIRYWPLVDATGKRVPFERRPDIPSATILRLHDWCQDLDEYAWAAHHVLARAVPAPAFALDAALDPDLDALLALLLLARPTDVQIAEAVTRMKALIDQAVTAGRWAYFKLANNRYVWFYPHGVVRTPAAASPVQIEQKLLMEHAATRLVNYNNLKARYPSAPNGLVNAASYSIAANWRFGCYEAYEHREFVVVDCTVTSVDKLTVVNHHAQPGANIPAGLAVGQVVDIAQVKYKTQLGEYANGMVAVAGYMHYLFNHTTGGNTATGPLMSMAMLYKLYDPASTVFTAEEQTSVLYEALHPVNKRFIANMVLKRTQVATYARPSCANQIGEIRLDTFLRLRANPYPAGSHKAYITLMVLGRLCRSFLAQFLPWSAELNNVITICSNILSNGARAHIGSNYYTGLPPIAQGAELDNYLPDLAVYIQTMAKNDTLAFSPHLSAEVAARANTNWANALKKIKSEDISATDPEIIREFLQTTGSVYFTFDPKDKKTWANAAKQSSDAAQAILQVISKF